MARRLTIDMVEFATPDNLRHIALDILQLDHVDWMYINTLNFGDYSPSYDFSYEQAVASESDKAEVARTMQYFGQNMRNIAELNLRRPGIKAKGDTIGASFAYMYGGQLQILREQAVLELTLDSSAARILPSICGETLRVLKLSSVPRNFAWHHFRYDVFVRPIVFPRLTILSLSYKYQFADLTKDEVQRKITLGAFNCDQLLFPVLKKMEISNCTPDCDLLYADTPFPELEEVDLSGSLDEIRHCTRLRLACVGDLYVYIRLLEIDDITDFYSVTNHFCSSICIGRTAHLDIYRDRDSIDPGFIRWANLTYLTIFIVGYETACKLIARLPNLIGFQASRLEFGTTLADTFSVDESLFLSTDPLLAWGAKLATIKIAELDNGFPIPASACRIQALILHACALRKFIVPEYIMSSVAAFIDEYKGRHPHLANIFVQT
ncbi:hypothetical protein GGI00_000209 [Coemansia sp. RSA 2681]|nr:hypothetical protein GGI00_000209 [Coemansia sp. RSA 2681]